MFGLISTAHAAEEATGGGISVHLAPYVLGYVGGLPITSTLVTTWLAMLVLIVTAFVLRGKLRLLPGKFQSLMEMLVGGAFDYVADVLENRQLAMKYFPIIMTIFLFILVMNWFGLLPGVTSIGFWEGHGEESHLIPLLYPPATDLNITLAFAIVAFVTIEFAGIVALGVFKYGGKFITFKSPLAFLIGIIELMSELARLISFSFRLFGNIFAGKTLLLVVMALTTPYILPVPLIAYELFVGFIQAFVFAILTLYFIKLAVEEPH